jgi:phage/plasmid-associated DNA primase
MSAKSKSDAIRAGLPVKEMNDFLSKSSKRFERSNGNKTNRSPMVGRRGFRSEHVLRVDLPGPPEELRPTEVAQDVPAAADLLEKRLPPVVCVGGDWFFYHRGIWQSRNKHVYRPRALEVLARKKQTHSYAQQVLSTVESRKQVPKEQLRGFARFDETGAVLVCCANGVLRVTAQAAHLMPHSPIHCFTGQLAAAYDPEASCNLFTKISNKALPDEKDRGLWGAFCGYTLYPGCDLEVALFCYGASGTSKTTLWAHGIGATLGRSLVTFVKLSQICGGHGYSIPRLERAALNLGSETAAGELIESDNFKLLVEGASMEVRSIYRAPYTMSDYCTKFVFLGNHLPKFKSATDAEVRRSRFLHFGVKPPRPDPTLKARLARERNGILSRFMVPWLQWLIIERRMPFGGDESLRLQDRFSLENDPLKVFTDAACEFGNEFSETKARLFGEWESFCEHHDITTGLRNFDEFCKRLRQRYPSLTSYKPSCGGQRVPSLRGIRLTPEAEQGTG